MLKIHTQSSPHSIFLLFALLVSAWAYDYQQTLLAANQGDTITHDISSIPIGNIIQIKFERITSVFSTISLMANTNALVNPNDIYEEDFYHEDPQDAR